MKRMNPKARRYLLTRQPEPPSFGYESLPNVFVGGRWGWQTSDSKDSVRHFSTPQGRDEWVAKNPLARAAIGKRHPLVKAFKQRYEKMGRT